MVVFGINNAIKELKNERLQLNVEISELEIDIIDMLKRLRKYELNGFDSVDEFIKVKDDSLELLFKDSSYVSGLPVSNHFESTIYENVYTGETYVVLVIEKSNDLCSENIEVLLKFQDDFGFFDKFYEKITEANKIILYKDVKIYINILNSEIEILDKNGNFLFSTDVYDFDILKRKIDSYFDYD